MGDQPASVQLPGPAVFRVDGYIATKTNLRWTQDKNAKAKWKAIKAYEGDVGYSATASGAKRLLTWDGQFAVTIIGFNQRVDLDNTKPVMDGMKKVVIPDDRPGVVSRFHVEHHDDGGDPYIIVQVRPIRPVSAQRFHLGRLIWSVAEHAIDRISDPKNVIKGGWAGMSWADWRRFIWKELDEAEAEVGRNDPKRFAEEAGDVVAFLAMGLDRIARRNRAARQSNGRGRIKVRR